MIATQTEQEKQACLQSRCDGLNNEPDEQTQARLELSRDQLAAESREERKRPGYRE